MLTKRVYGTSVKKINGRTVKRLEYDGDSDGENMVMNVMQNGTRKRFIIPEIQRRQSFVLPKLFYVRRQTRKIRKKKNKKKKKKKKKKNKSRTKRIRLEGGPMIRYQF